MEKKKDASSTTSEPEAKHQVVVARTPQNFATEPHSALGKAIVEEWQMNFLLNGATSR